MVGVEDILDPLFEFGLALEIEALKTKLPFLRVPIVSQFIDWILRKFMTQLYTPGRNAAIYLQVKLTKEHQNEELKEAVEQIKTIVAEGATDEQIRQAREEIRKRARDLVRVNI
nr:hypothetical protein BHI3_07740 [Bacteriovorax sp. HI3]